MCIVVTYLESLGSPGGGTVGLPTNRPSYAETRCGGHPHTHFTRTYCCREASCLSSPQPSGCITCLTVYQLQRSCVPLSPKKQVDAVLSWGHDAALPWIWPKKRCSAWSPHISSYSIWMNRQTGETGEALSGWVVSSDPLKRADITFALSNFTREEIIALFDLESERVIVTYWGVDAMFAQVQRSFAGRCPVHSYGSLPQRESLIYLGSGVASLVSATGYLSQVGAMKSGKHASTRTGLVIVVILGRQIIHWLRARVGSTVILLLTPSLSG